MSIEELLRSAIESLASRRPIFHSEMDFQLALAWEIQTQQPEAEIRLEKRVIDEPRVELDVLVALDGVHYGIELKFPRSAVDLEVDNERFVLRTGAPDLDRYDVLRDVGRLERLVAEGIIHEGAALVLTNVAGLWRAPRPQGRASYDSFRIHQDREIDGALEWGPTAGAGTRIGREHPLFLAGHYRCEWNDFSEVADARFRYLLLCVEGPRPEALPDPELLA